MHGYHMHRGVSPHKYCLYFAIGCIDSRREQGTLSDDNHATLLESMSSTEGPDPHLMRICFPRVYHAVGHHPTLRDMHRYWKMHERDSEPTPVFTGTALSCALTDGERGDMWLCRYFDTREQRMRSSIFCNMRQLELTAGMRVKVHGTTIALAGRECDAL